jgi:hypothetical protein
MDSKFPVAAGLACDKTATATVLRELISGEQPFRHDRQIKINISAGHIINNTDMLYLSTINDNTLSSMVPILER